MAGTGRGAEGSDAPRPLYAFNGGLLARGRVRRILELAGWELRFGRPGAGDWVGIWGASPTAWRGRAIAERRGAGLLRIEDAFLRSVRPGRGGDPPIGLIADPAGIHFDPATPSRIEQILTGEPLDSPALLARAAAGIALVRHLGLSKYNLHLPECPVPKPGYQLVLDQTAGDAAVRASGADAATFRAMLRAAKRAAGPGRVVVRLHPETVQGLRPGHFAEADLAGCEIAPAEAGPWALLEGAAGVHTVSSQMGFEAILAGHRPVVWGQPFYAGWGLSDDRNPPPRRGLARSREQLFAAAMLLAPIWYDPHRDRLCSFEEAALALDALARAWREDRAGWVAGGIRLWKRGPLRAFAGAAKGIRFVEPPARAPAEAAATGARAMVWAGRAEGLTAPVVRVEDGFLRSRGLGAELVPPLSLVFDDLGIYYDPGRESRLERLIAEAADLPPVARARAEALLLRLRARGVTKYNLGGAGLPAGLPAGRRILVVGQVEDDASIRLGATGEVRTNRALLVAARAAYPAAVLLYKPHPDVEAGLRPGTVGDAAALADAVLSRTDPLAAIAAADEVWTLTSTLGFEALLREKPVVCLGQPFYAGWGLTEDRGPPLPRRSARPDLIALVHAALIAYPRYHDPVSGLPCPPEVALDRLAHGDLPRPSRRRRLLARLQGRMASQAWLWRR